MAGDVQRYGDARVCDRREPQREPGAEQQQERADLALAVFARAREQRECGNGKEREDQAGDREAQVASARPLFAQQEAERDAPTRGERASVSSRAPMRRCYALLPPSASRS